VKIWISNCLFDESIDSPANDREHWDGLKHDENRNSLVRIHSVDKQDRQREDHLRETMLEHDHHLPTRKK